MILLCFYGRSADTVAAGCGPGGIAAIAVGGTAALALGAVLVIRRKKQK